MFRSIFILILTCCAYTSSADDSSEKISTEVDVQAETPETVVTTPSGLKYRVLQIGAGRSVPELSDRVTVHYSGKLLDGTEFDNTRKRGRPASFAISRVIEGWAEGLQLMT